LPEKFAVRLDAHVLAPEDLFRAIDGQPFDGVDILAAAVPAFPGITFRILVRQDTALRFHDGAAGEIFRGDQLDVLALAILFRDDCLENFRVHFAQTAAGGGGGAGARRGNVVRLICHGKG
jgi:hypothetical protein